MTLNNLPLVNWGTGTLFLVIFLVVCVVLVLVVLNLMKGDKKKNEDL